MTEQQQIDMVVVHPNYRVEVHHRLGEPAQCKVWSRGTLVFDGVSREALLRKGQRGSSLARKLIAMLVKRNPVFGVLDLDRLGMIFGVSTNDLISVAWEYVEDGVLTYHADATFQRAQQE